MANGSKSTARAIPGAGRVNHLLSPPCDQAARRRTYARVEEKLYVIGAAWLATLLRRVVPRRALLAGRFAVARRAAGRAVVERVRAVVAGLRRAVVVRAVVVGLRRAAVVRFRAVVVGFARAVVVRLRAVVVALRRAVVLVRAVELLRTGLFRAVEVFRAGLLRTVARFAAGRFAVVRFAAGRFAAVRLAAGRFAAVRLAAGRFAVVRFAVARFAAGRRFAVVRLVVLLLAFRAGRFPALLLLRAVCVRLAARAGRLRVVDDLRVVGIVTLCSVAGRPLPRRAAHAQALPGAQSSSGWPPCLASAPRNVADNRGRKPDRHCRTAR